MQHHLKASPPEKGDICVFYAIFDSDINGKVLPFIENNFITILKSAVMLHQREAAKVSKSFLAKVKEYDVWPE